ncbi:MAG TPA: asparaginase [Burkholderiales bacterium]|nr:asparaginase [Burkholderiales bacterium]
MTNPVIAEVVRGARLESRHRGSVAVVDAAGAVVFALGDTGAHVYPRSAVKALQALVLVECGGADRFGLGTEALALACASHGGEPGHVQGVEGMLKAAGLDPSALACGAHWPSHGPSAQALMRAGRTAESLHNNCSGKHAGFLCAARAMGGETAGYAEPTHAVQREVKAVLESVAGIAIPEDARATDGCSVPTWAIPLVSLAGAFARFGSGQGLGRERARAAERLRSACAAHPWHVAGTGRFCTRLMEHFRERAFVKTGAEGVFCGALPQQGLGIAVKCDDGAARAAEVAMATLVARYLPLRPEDETALDPLRRPILRNWNGREVGGILPVF